MIGTKRIIMPNITIYTKSTCSYCHAAKHLLREKQVSFTEISVDGDAEGVRAMSVRAQGRTSVPQIFFDDRHIGGCDDLYALEKAGNLDQLLSAGADK